MLEHFRTFASYKPVRWIFVIFLVGVFGLFGVETYLQRPASGDAVATVGKARISGLEFDNALRQQADRMRAQFRNAFDPSMLDTPEARQVVLDQLVNEKALAVGSERAGLTIPDKALAQRIAEFPPFQVDGKFSADRYEQIARSQGLSRVGLDERLRQSFAEDEFRSAITDTTIVPKATLDSFIRLSEQTREVSVVNLTPEAYAAKVKITPEQVQAYYDGHKAEFTIPERARVEYIEYSVDKLASKLEVPQGEIEKAYEEGMKQNRWGQPEQRRASHILISAGPKDDPAKVKAAEDKAKAIAEQVRKNPKLFADIAKKESQDPGSGAQGGDLGFFGRGQMVKPFEDAAFGGKKGDIIGPVKSDFGFHVIQVTDVKPAKVKSLAEAAPELEGELKKQLAQRRFGETAEQFANLVYEQPASLKPAADALKVPVQQGGWIVKGQVANPLFSNPKLQSEIFSDDAIKAKRNTSAIEVQPNTLIAAHVVEFEPSKVRPLDTLRGDIERRLQREEGVKLARADGEAKLKELQAGKPADVKWPAALAVNRQKPGGLLPTVIDKAFRVDAKKLPGYVGVDTPMGYSLVQVSKVIDVPEIKDDQRQAMSAGLRQAVSATELEATVANIRNRVGVSVSREAIEKKPGQQ
jgi:peptidyl-prolyl cis-trans isomerase D